MGFLVVGALRGCGGGGKRSGPLSEKPLFTPINGENSAQNFGGKKLSYPFQAILRLKKEKRKRKWHGPLSH